MELLLSKAYRKLFTVKNLEEKSESWELLVIENESNIPESLEGNEAVLNGYCNDVEIIDFPFRGKVMYITFRRRKWKESNEVHSVSNSYHFHKKGMKTTDEFGDFLKSLPAEEYLEFFRAFPSLRHLQQENI